MTSFDTVVVGGGIAGIAAATALVEEGQRVVLLEAGPELGGRAITGPHVVFTEYVNLLRLLRMLGTESLITWDRERFSTEVQGTREIVTRMSLLPAPFHFVPSLVADRTLRNRDWLSNASVTLFALSLSEEELLRLDDRVALDVLRRWRVSERYIDRFWRYFSHAIMNVPLERCSAASILRAYRRLIGKRGYRVGYPPLDARALFAPVATRVTVRTSTRVASVDDLDAPWCVLATPPDERFQPVPYISVYLWFDRKLTGLPFWSRRYDPNDLNLDFYDYANIGAGRSESLIASNVIDSARVGVMSDEAIVQRTLGELREFLPAAAEARLLRSRVLRIPMAIPAPVPGFERLRPASQLLRPGLVIAGDWIQTGMPASMESACYAGFRAAETVLGRSGIAVRHRELDRFAAMLGGGVRRLRRERDAG